MQSAREQEVVATQLRVMQPSLERCSGLARDFKLNRPMRFLLRYNGSGQNVRTVRNIADPELC